MNKLYIAALTVGIILFIGCGKSTEETLSSVETVPSVFVDQAIIAEPTPIPKARTSKPGEKIALTGLVMGVPNPFVAGRAAFVLGDEATLQPCDLKADDHCSTPWDVCCDPDEVKLAGTATIQVLGENGKLLPFGLKGMNGLAELSRVTVSGTVASNSSPDAFIVNADAIHIGVR